MAATAGLTSFTWPVGREQLQICAQPASEAAHAISSITVFCQACCKLAGTYGQLPTSALAAIYAILLLLCLVLHKADADKGLVQRQTAANVAERLAKDCSIDS